MNETIAMLEEISGRRLEVERTRGRRRRPAADEGGHDADPRRPRLAAETSLEDGLRAQWEWAAVESPA